MIFGANYIIWITAFLVIILVFWGKSKEKKAFLLSVLGVIFSAILIFIIRRFFVEPRPFVTLAVNPLISESSSSAAFPSMHTTLMAVIAFAYLFAKSKWTPLFMFFLIWVGLARIFVGVHYPFDILGGILVGFLVVWFSNWLLKLIFSMPQYKQQS